MKILFLGQRGIPTLSRSALRERRVEALATHLAEAGHAVTASCTRPFVSPSLSGYNRIALRHVPSLSRFYTGDLFRTLFELWLTWRERSDVVHVHGWRLGLLFPLIVLLNPEATFIWTIDALPARRGRFTARLARWAVEACDAVATPSRQLQYHLLVAFGIRAHYVPDGFTPPVLPDVPVRRFGLRAGQYCATTATDPAAIRRVAESYAHASTRKKLVVLQEKDAFAASSSRRGQMTRLARRYPFLRIIELEGIGQRVPLSILREAAAVIVAGSAPTQETLLQVMHSGTPLIAEAVPSYQEVLGVAGLFVASDDADGLTEALTVASNRRKLSIRGLRGKRRAEAHFTWDRILSEYLELYYAQVTRPVSVDSAQPSFAKAHLAG